MVKYLEFENFKQPAIAYSKAGKLLWANRRFLWYSGYTLQELRSRTLEDLVDAPHLRDKAEIVGLFHRPDIAIEAFKLRVNPALFENPGAMDERGLRVKDRFGVYASAYLSAAGNGSAVAFLMPYSDDAGMVRYTELGYCMVDERFRIVEYNEHFYRLTPDFGIKKDIKYQPLPVFAVEEDWQHFAATRDAVRRALSAQRKEGAAGWKYQALSLMPGVPAGGWHFSPSKSWQLSSGELHLSETLPAAGHAISTGRPSMAGGELKIEFEARASEWEGLGVFVRGRAEGFFDTPDEGGFLAVVHGKSLHLKQNCETVALAPRPELKGEGWNTISVEVIGGHVCVRVNGAEVIEYFEAPLLAGPGQEHTGFFARHPAAFRNVRVSAREAGAGPREGYAPLHDMRFKASPGRVFEMRMLPRLYGENLLTGVLLTDVTVLREKEAALLTAQRAREILSRENISLKSALFSGAGALDTQSVAAGRVYKAAREVAASQVSILIEGETGTGKEVLAQAIHAMSLRALSPFIKVDCAALPENILESELFGHEKGAFTGALERRVGRFELAHGGTVFLDEIGNLSPAIQVKLLRVLQDKSFERVGGVETVTSDFRLVCATNESLEQMVATGRFRQDLYYRINVVLLKLPALRERLEDLPSLALTFIREFSQKNRKPVRSINAAALGLLHGYRWPGNIRELRNVIENAVVLCGGEELGPKDFARLTPSPDPAPQIRRQPLADHEDILARISELVGARARSVQGEAMSKRRLSNALRKARGKVGKAAAGLGLKPARLYYLLRCLGLSAKDYA